VPEHDRTRGHELRPERPLPAVARIGTPDLAHEDLDHAIEMVREKTAARYPVEHANEETQTKFEELSSYASNIVGINMYLNKADGWEHPMADASSAG